MQNVSATTSVPLKAISTTPGDRFAEPKVIGTSGVELDLSRYALLAFDSDGTVVCSEDLHRESYRLAASELLVGATFQLLRRSERAVETLEVDEATSLLSNGLARCRDFILSMHDNEQSGHFRTPIIGIAASELKEIAAEQLADDDQRELIRGPIDALCQGTQELAAFWLQRDIIDAVAGRGDFGHALAVVELLLRNYPHLSAAALNLSRERTLASHKEADSSYAQLTEQNLGIYDGHALSNAILLVSALLEHRVRHFVTRVAAIQPIEDIERLLKARAPSQRTALVTGTVKEIVAPMLQGLDLFEQFDQIVTPYDYHVRAKPDPAPYRVARRGANLRDADLAITFEDTVGGAVSGLLAGYDVVLRAARDDADSVHEASKALSARLDELRSADGSESPRPGFGAAFIVPGNGWERVGVRNSLSGASFPARSTP